MSFEISTVDSQNMLAANLCLNVRSQSVKQGRMFYIISLNAEVFDSMWYVHMIRHNHILVCYYFWNELSLASAERFRSCFIILTAYKVFSDVF